MSDNVEILTFTGVDETTDLRRLAEIAERYPKVEFGVLVGSQEGGIFPPRHVIESLKNVAKQDGFRVALHLCGKHSRAVMKPDPDAYIWGLCRGFGRVQINLHGDFWDGRWIDVGTYAVRQFADAIDGSETTSVILQHRAGWDQLPVSHPRVEYLWDTSGGGGIDSIDKWPDPHDVFDDKGMRRADMRFGFAGGLGPYNMRRAMEFAARHASFPMWFDMEGNVRTRGWFDLDRVEEVCAIAFPERGA